MKKASSGTVKLLLSILIFVAFHFLYFKVFNTAKIRYDVARFIEYVLVIILISLIYRGELKHKRSGYGKGLFNTFIYVISCFIFLMFITVVISKFFKTPNNLMNYFNINMDLKNILMIIENCIFIPFLECAIFVLGFSLIFKKKIGTCIASGVAFGILNGLYYGFGVNLILPIIIITILSLLYETNHNIWSVVITYSLYIAFGFVAIKMFV